MILPSQCHAFTTQTSPAFNDTSLHLFAHRQTRREIAHFAKPHNRTTNFNWSPKTRRLHWNNQRDVDPKPLARSSRCQASGKRGAKSKGFGELLTKERVKGGQKINEASNTVDQSAVSSTPEISRDAACPCGGGEERIPYKECCGRYHGGVKEPDALTLMKARYSAYAKSVIPYIVRTTHPDNPDIKRGGPTQLEEDCKATCGRVMFKRLEIIEFEPPAEASADVEASIDVSNSDVAASADVVDPIDLAGGDVAFVSFRVTYAYLHGTTKENQFLVEKSKFLKDPKTARWLYAEKIPLDPSAEAAWKHGTWLINRGEEQKKEDYRKSYRPHQSKLKPRSV